MNIDDDLIIDIDSGVAELATPSKPIGPTGVRPSALAKGGPAKPAVAPDADRIAVLERERDAAAAARDAERARVAEVTERYTREAARAAEAERMAGERTEQAMRAHWERMKSEHSQIVGAIAQTQSEADIAQREYVSATEAGDAASAAKAQRAMSRAEAALMQLESGRTASEQEIARTRALFENHEVRARQPERHPERQPEPKEQPKEPERAPTPDEWIDGARGVLGDDGAAWLREHKEFADVSSKMNRKFVRFADDYAEDHGKDALRSPQFLAEVNAKFFPQAEAETDETGEGSADVDLTEDQPAQPQRKAAPSAPVSRSSPARPQQTTGGGRVRLSTDEQAIATQMYPDMDRNSALKKYASNKARAMADGLYNNNR